MDGRRRLGGSLGLYRSNPHSICCQSSTQNHTFVSLDILSPKMDLDSRGGDEISMRLSNFVRRPRGHRPQARQQGLCGSGGVAQMLRAVTGAPRNAALQTTDSGADPRSMIATLPYWAAAIAHAAARAHRCIVCAVWHGQGQRPARYLETGEMAGMGCSLGLDAGAQSQGSGSLPQVSRQGTEAEGAAARGRA